MFVGSTNCVVVDVHGQLFRSYPIDGLELKTMLLADFFDVGSSTVDVVERLGVLFDSCLEKLDARFHRNYDGEEHVPRVRPACTYSRVRDPSVVAERA